MARTSRNRTPSKKQKAIDSERLEQATEKAQRHQSKVVDHPDIIAERRLAERRSAFTIKPASTSTRSLHHSNTAEVVQQHGRSHSRSSRSPRRRSSPVPASNQPRTASSRRTRSSPTRSFTKTIDPPTTRRSADRRSSEIADYLFPSDEEPEENISRDREGDMDEDEDFEILPAKRKPSSTHRHQSFIEDESEEEYDHAKAQSTQPPHPTAPTTRSRSTSAGPARAPPAVPRTASQARPTPAPVSSRRTKSKPLTTSLTVNSGSRTRNRSRSLSRSQSRSRSRSRSRSVHPSAVNKRKAESDFDDESQMRAKRNSTGGHGRPKAADYSADLKGVIQEACGAYRASLASTQPFPDCDQERHMIKEVWSSVLEEKEMTFNMTEDIRKIIACSTSQLRGDVKTVAKDVTKTLYGFSSRDCKALANRALYQKLVTQNAYLYEDVDKLRAVWFHASLFEVTRRVWFKNKKADGLVYDSVLNPIPPPAIALVFTAIRCSLDEWSEGHHRPLHFTSIAYEGIYHELLNGLMELKTASAAGAKLVLELGKELWDESSQGLLDAQRAGGDFTVEHDVAIRDAEERATRKQAEAEKDAAALLDY